VLLFFENGCRVRDGSDILLMPLLGRHQEDKADSPARRETP